MTKPTVSAADQVWEAVEKERWRDRLIRRVSVSAWLITLLFVVILIVLLGLQTAELASRALAGVLPWVVVFGSAMPFVIALGLLSLLVATLSTIGVFFRLRTASLTEIQLRLAALEEIIAAQGASVSASSSQRVDS